MLRGALLLAGGVATGAALRRTPARRVSVGWAPSGKIAYRVLADEVSLVDEQGVRFFLDGSLVGLVRALCAHLVLGPPVNDIVEISPDWTGAFVPVAASATQWIYKEAAKGRWVIGPTTLAFDTGGRRYLWSSADAGPATGTEAFAVLCAPGAGPSLRSLAEDPLSGGG